MAIQEKYFLADYVRSGFPLHLGRNRVPVVPFHTHDFYEIAFLEKGTLGHEFEHRPGATLESGDFVLINPFERHGYHQEKGPIQIVNCIFAAHYPALLGRGLGQEALLAPFHFDSRVGHPDPVEKKELAALFTHAGKEYEGKKKGWELAVTGMVLQVLTLCRRVLEKSSATPMNPYRFRLTPVLAQIDGNFTTDLSLSALAKWAGLHSSYLSELFRKATGKTFKQYLVERRLRYAVHLLEHGGSPVREVCLASGFHDLTHFERQIRRFTGQTPLELRRIAAHGMKTAVLK